MRFRRESVVVRQEPFLAELSAKLFKFLVSQDYFRRYFVFCFSTDCQVKGELIFGVHQIKLIIER